LSVAGLEWKEWAIARSRVVAMLAVPPQQQTERVDHDVPLAPIDQFAAVEATAVGSDDGICLDGLRVDDPGHRLRIPPQLLADLRPEPVVELLGRPAVTPPAEEGMHPVHGGKSPGIARPLMPLSTRRRIASGIARWQYASGCPPRPRSRAGTGSSGRTASHSPSVMSDG
jgi:hypothetical protein